MDTIDAGQDAVCGICEELIEIGDPIIVLPGGDWAHAEHGDE